MIGTARTHANAGNLFVTGPGGRLEESDTATCFHCNRVWIVKSTVAAKADPGGWCGMCSRMICPRCATGPDAGKCVPFERKLDEMEAADRMLRAMQG